VSERARIDVYVQPRASRTEVTGRHDGCIRIRLAAPPVDGAANAALIEFVAERTRVARSAVRIVRGTTGRRKTVEVDGVPAAAVEAALLSQ
jgi:uncharacterized protein (TIGR00251 family)